MNEQEIFDTVVNHLRQQARKSETINVFGASVGAYRGSDNTKCSIGCLIPDEEYAPWMEGNNIYPILFNQNAPKSLKDRLLPHIDLVIALQTVHDKNPIEHWEARFQRNSEKYKLRLAP